MAETENQAEPTLQAKRKPDLLREDEEVNAKKIQKLPSKNGNDCDENNSSVSEPKIEAREPELAEEEDEEDYEEEDEDDEDGDSNGKAVVDGKGKGISRDDKGKGKMIEEESGDDEDSDSDDDSGSGESEDESDLSDDPLAEVDLDNILPSRTRRRAAQPGFSIGNDRRDC